MSVDKLLCVVVSFDVSLPLVTVVAAVDVTFGVVTSVDEFKGAVVVDDASVADVAVVVVSVVVCSVVVVRVVVPLSSLEIEVVVKFASVVVLSGAVVVSLVAAIVV